MVFLSSLRIRTLCAVTEIKDERGIALSESSNRLSTASNQDLSFMSDARVALFLHSLALVYLSLLVLINPHST
jgi:hypothetical protein